MPESAAPVHRLVPGPAGGRLRSTLRLSKSEAFEACQALADADRCLQRVGRLREAAALANVFELLESRLTERGPGPYPSVPDGSSEDDPWPASGSYSSEREFTQ